MLDPLAPLRGGGRQQLVDLGKQWGLVMRTVMHCVTVSISGDSGVWLCVLPCTGNILYTWDSGVWLSVFYVPHNSLYIWDSGVWLCVLLCTT